MWNLQTDHGLQVLQWAVALCSLGFSLVVLDEVVTERDPDTPAENRNEASRVDGLMLTGVDNVLFENDTVHILSTGTGGEWKISKWERSKSRREPAFIH